MSVQGQQKSPQFRITPQPTPDPSITIQDDNGGGYFVLDPTTGKFQCVLCEYNVTLSGYGEVKIDGCTIYFSYIEKSSYRLFATANICEQQATMACELYALPDSKYDIEPILEYWKDSSMKDSTATCPMPKVDYGFSEPKTRNSYCPCVIHLCATGHSYEGR